MAAMHKTIHTRTDKNGTGVMLNKRVASGMISSVYSGWTDCPGSDSALSGGLRARDDIPKAVAADAAVVPILKKKMAAVAENMLTNTLSKSCAVSKPVTRPTGTGAGFLEIRQKRDNPLKTQCAI
jgi:hypothetical protein